jgi:hypothetical protein
MADAVERFKSDPMEFVGVIGGTLIYVGIKRREEFDAIALPCQDFGENERGHVLTKSGYIGKVYIVFQHWLKSLTVEAMMADREAAKRADEEAAIGAAAARTDEAPNG